MRLRLSNFIYKLLSGLLFTLISYILLEPWLSYFFQLAFHHPLNNYQLSWVFILLMVAVYTGEYLVNFEKNRRLFFIVLFLVMENLLLFFLELPLSFFIPVSLLLLIVGLRFSLYSYRLEFSTDLTIASLFLLFSLAVSGRYNLNISLSSIIMFFLAAIILIQSFNILEMEKKGYARQKKLLLATAVFFLLILIIASLLTGLPLTNFLGGSLAFLGWLYDKLVTIVMWIINPVLYLLAPIINYLAKIIRSFSDGELPENIGTGDEPILDQENLEIAEYNPPVFLGWIILIVILVFILYYLVLKLQRNDQERTVTGFKEERSSVFSISELKDDFKNIWSVFKNPFSGQEGMSIYDGSSFLLIIREIYYKFLVKYSKLVALKPSNTPLEYLKKLLHDLDEDIFQSSEIKPEEFQELTALYNQARYGEKADRQDVKEAEAIWEKVSAEINEKRRN